MKIFRFDPSVAQDRDDYGSTSIKLVQIAQLVNGLSIVCIHLGKNGKLAHHRTINNQLFLVVQGKGIVSGNNAITTPITAGQAAFWKAGEWHETTSQNGLMAIVLEGSDLNPSQFMEELVINDE